MTKKNPLKSKTLWFNAFIAGLGALEAAAPGTLPAGPTMIAISVVGAILRTMTTAAVK